MQTDLQAEILRRINSTPESDRHTPMFATRLNNLGVVYQAQGKFPEADDVYRRAQAIWESTHGSNHPRVAVVLNNRAAFYRRLGEY